ncbi:glycine betaine ABC transporter substrate-binding protein [Mycobacterium sp. URHB0044]|jgi:glycine betaine/choline ABC-type transport system substrate-binding protein|uniref:glycine betaine ABC transporter substrate-binding protein n=1 Tax=Mycobacterium sp. URHB0044 TaxID=1380386 RepID=UPI00048B6EF0|nr:glycine betaine ABC transporter substrate-binding protein [Mycobacterium sp. URHB0044]
MRRLAVALVALLIAGCGGPSGPPSIAVGAGDDPESVLLAHVYAAALRYYGSPAHVESGSDPVAELDTGDVTVVPGLTGRLLKRFAPDAAARADEQVYRSMISALPEGIGAGDYAQSAQDKPALAVTEATARAWNGHDLTSAVRHCGAIEAGAVASADASADPPAAIGTCRLPAAREFPDAATLFGALRAGEVNAAWTSTAAPNLPDDVVVLSDRTALVRAENVVPLYRRNELTEQQVIALNQVAGELDTGGLADMRRQVADGTDPGAVAGAWLDAHPLGH